MEEGWHRGYELWLVNRSGRTKPEGHREWGNRNWKDDLREVSYIKHVGDEAGIDSDTEL